MWAHVIITHVTSYDHRDVLVKGVVLYPMEVTLDFWSETTHY